MSSSTIADAFVVQADTAFTKSRAEPIRHWLFHFQVDGPGLDKAAMARITDAFLLAVDAEGATAGAGGGLAEIIGEQDHDTPGT